MIASALLRSTGLQGYLLPSGAPPEDQSRQTEAWSAGIAYGCLLHDVGKIAVDIAVELEDGTVWHPWDGILIRPYRFRYLKKRDPRLHNVLPGFFVRDILGAEIMTWLSRYPELWNSLLYLLAGNYEQAGIMAEIVGKADRLSTALNVGAHPERILLAPDTSQQKQWLLGLRALVKEAQEQQRINVKGEPYWLTQDSLWMVSKVVMDSLRGHLLKQNLSNVPQNNRILFDELQSFRIIEPTPENRAVWTIHLDDGAWSTKLTCVRVKPSLIWGKDQPPEVFRGKVTILDGRDGVQDEGEETRPQDSGTSADKSVATKPALVESVQPSATAGTVGNPNASLDGDDGIDAVLNLFSGSVDRAIKERQAPEDVLEPAKTDTKRPSEENSDEAGNSRRKVLQTGASAAENSKSASTPKNPAGKAPGKLTDLEKQGRRLLAEEFVAWLKEGIVHHKLAMNDTSAKIHIVGGQVFLVTPGIFQRFCLERSGEDDAWRKVQQGFEKLKLHRKRNDDLNIWACNVNGPRKMGKKIQGYLLPSEQFFPKRRWTPVSVVD